MRYTTFRNRRGVKSTIDPLWPARTLKTPLVLCYCHKSELSISLHRATSVSTQSSIPFFATSSIFQDDVVIDNAPKDPASTIATLLGARLSFCCRCLTALTIMTALFLALLRQAPAWEGFFICQLDSCFTIHHNYKEESSNLPSV